MNTLELSKFDVVERQLLQAIRMFFREEDPVSIHTLSEAAAQVLNDIGSSYGTHSHIREGYSILHVTKKEWLDLIFQSRNFFKHADRDKDSVHSFKLEWNDFSLIDAVSMYGAIKKKWVPETKAFILWFFLMYPDLLKEKTNLSIVLEHARKYGNIPDHNNKIMFLELIEKMRQKSVSIDDICLEYGL